MTKQQTVLTAWDAVMDESKNPLRSYPLATAHMLMQALAWMWCAIFSIAIGSFAIFGATAVGHALIIAGVFVTLMVFQRAEDHRANGAE